MSTKSAFMRVTIRNFELKMDQQPEEFKGDSVSEDMHNHLVQRTWNDLENEVDSHGMIDGAVLKEIEWYIENQSGIMVSVLGPILSNWEEFTGKDEYC